MQVRLDVADRLVRAVVENGGLPAGEAARILLALPGASGALAELVLADVVRGDGRLAWAGDRVVLAGTPWASIPLERARFAVLDVETTGLSAASARLTELGAVLLDAGRPVADFEAFVDGEEDCAKALHRLRRFARGAVLAGHNIRFDLSFLDAELRRAAGARVAAPAVDTLVLARRLLAGRIEGAGLCALAEFFGTSERPCHRALPDARATAEVLVRLLELARERGARTVGDLCALARTAAFARPDPIRPGR
jgi:DNA polymerase III epsilon subunit-like protein